MKNYKELKRKFGKGWWVIHLDGNRKNDEEDNLIAVPDYVGEKLVGIRNAQGSKLIHSQAMAVWMAEREKYEIYSEEIKHLQNEIEAIKTEARNQVRELERRLHSIKQSLESRPVIKKQTVKHGKKSFVQKIVRRSAKSQVT